MLQGRGRATYKGETSEVNELKLTTDVCESERPEIVKRARLIFDQFYGVPRRSGKDNREHRVGEGAPSSLAPKEPLTSSSPSSFSSFSSSSFSLLQVCVCTISRQSWRHLSQSWVRYVCLGLGMYVLGCMSWACMPGVRQSWSHLRQSWRHVRQSWVRYATIGGFRVAECSSGYCWYARPRPTMPSESDNVAALSSQS